MQKFTLIKSISLFIMLSLFVGVSHAQMLTNPSDQPQYDVNKAAQVSEAAKAQQLDQQAQEAEFTNDPGNGNRSLGCVIPVDGSFTAVPRNDDGSYGPISLPFNFDLYGVNYTSAYINTNGNITFLGPVSTYSSYGFPYYVPMVAPFWGDVDTRNGGLIYYKVNSTNLIVTWNNVGYYSYQAGAPNTFQAILTDGNDPIVGIGNNVAFNYGEMRWTTGNASGGYGGFGGTPATVGINKGNNVDYVQIGRFNQNNSNYDGPGGSPDGVNYLDYQCFNFNVSNATNQPPSVSGVPAGNTIDVACGETQTFSLNFIGPEVSQTVVTTVNTGGLCNTTTNISNGNVSTATVTITGASCNQGSHVISFTATDNYVIPASTTVDITVNVVGSCCEAPVITAPADILVANDAGQCGANVSFAATSTGTPAPTMTYSHPSGSSFPVGTTEVTATATNPCGSSSATFLVTVEDQEAPVVLTQNVTLQLDASGQATLNVADLDGGSTDNCGIQDLLLMNGDGLVYGEINEGYNLTLTAPAGKVFTNILFASYGTPTGSGGNYQYGWCHAANSQSIVENYALGNNTFTIPAVNGLFGDPCGGTYKRLYVLAAYDNTAETITYSCSDVGVHTQTLTVVDVHGNTSSAAATVTVVDLLPPSVSTQDIVVALDATGSAAITAAQIDNGSFDNCGVASVTVAPADFSCAEVGPNTVTLTVTDNNGNVATGTATVTVEDLILPTVQTQDITVELDATGMAYITAGQIDDGSFDNCGVAALTVSPADFSCAEVGTNTVTLTVTDNNGNVAASSATVTVEDNILPVLTVIANPISLWPPNHKYETISMSDLFVSVWDNCGSLGIADVHITSVSSDEAENANGNGDGNTMNDIVISSDCNSVDLRKERNGNGNGRVYTIFLAVVDDNGNIGTASCQVVVPHNNGGTAIDDGMAYEEVCGGNKSASAFDENMDTELKNYPNPFNQSTTIQFSVPETNYTRLVVFNSQGMEVATLFDGVAESNQVYKLELKSADLPVGVYFYHLQSGPSISTMKKMIRMN